MPLPKNRSYAPVYTKDEEGKPALRFSGISYINFPLEAFPRGSFTLNFEIKPDAQEKPYVLFRHFSWILGSVTVYVKYDRLYTVFADRDLKVHSFASGFELKPGEWSNVTIAFDQKKLTFRVNGKSRSYKIASPLVPLYFKPAIFGGHTKQEFGCRRMQTSIRGCCANLKSGIMPKNNKKEKTDNEKNDSDRNHASDRRPAFRR